MKAVKDLFDSYLSDEFNSYYNEYINSQEDIYIIDEENHYGDRTGDIDTLLNHNLYYYTNSDKGIIFLLSIHKPSDYIVGLLKDTFTEAYGGGIEFYQEETVLRLALKSIKLTFIDSIINDDCVKIMTYFPCIYKDECVISTGEIKNILRKLIRGLR